MFLCPNLPYMESLYNAENPAYHSERKLVLGRFIGIDPFWALAGPFSPASYTERPGHMLPVRILCPTTRPGNRSIGCRRFSLVLFDR
jgi:hypothetical protein